MTIAVNTPFVVHNKKCRRNLQFHMYKITVYLIKIPIKKVLYNKKYLLLPHIIILNHIKSQQLLLLLLQSVEKEVQVITSPKAFCAA